MSKGWRLRALTGLGLFMLCLLCLVCGERLSELAMAKRGNSQAELAFTTDNLIRLHVIAHSDQANDQRVKLLVRNRILEETQRLVTACDQEEALGLLHLNRKRLQAAAVDELRKNGYGYSAAVQIGRFGFPEKEYAFGVLPSGEYHALRVILGDGTGQNWWCVLFPPVCHLTVEEKPKTPEVEVRLHWRAWENFQANRDELLTTAWNDWAKFFQLATVSSVDLTGEDDTGE